MVDDFNIFGNKPITPQTGFYYSYELLKAGLTHYLGDKATWLPEYSGIEEWLRDNKGKGLLCMGGFGRGKSVICRKIIPKILNMNNEKLCSVMSAYDLGRGLDTPTHHGFLVVDDIGVETEFSRYGVRQTCFNEVVDTAEEYGHILILTTNLIPDELALKYGERTLDRLKNITKVVLFNGESLRNKDFEGWFPTRHRAYGIDFQTEEEAVTFKMEQDNLYAELKDGKYCVFRDDYKAVQEHQPICVKDNVVYAYEKKSK